MTAQMPDNLSEKNRDLRAYTDKLRLKHAIVKNEAGEWVLLRHAEVSKVALDHDRFSSNVSRYLQIPNGLDGKEHTHYRHIIEKYLSNDALKPYVATFTQVAKKLTDELPRNTTIDAVNDIGAVFAVRAQCAWLGWPATLEPKLLTWMADNHEATRSGNHFKMADVAQRFDDIIRSIIVPLRDTKNTVSDDVTTRLCSETINKRKLNKDELISILRNWTGGDLGSIALCVGVIVAFIAKHPEYIKQLRSATDSEVEAFIDEVLRIDDPFVTNRRVTTCPVKIAGQKIPSGATVKLNWTSANRDETVFAKDNFDPENNAKENLVYGIGKHVCPGRLLATLELRIAIQTLLAEVNTLTLDLSKQSEREVSPIGGYQSVPIIIT